MNSSDILTYINEYTSRPGYYIELGDMDTWPEWLPRFIREEKVLPIGRLSIQSVMVLSINLTNQTVKVRFSSQFWVKPEYNFVKDHNTVTLPIKSFVVRSRGVKETFETFIKEFISQVTCGYCKDMGRFEVTLRKGKPAEIIDHEDLLLIC